MEKSLLGDPGSEPRPGGREKRRVCEDNQRDGNNKQMTQNMEKVAHHRSSSSDEGDHRQDSAYCQSCSSEL